MNSIEDLKAEAVTRRIRAQIENLKYDRDLIIQQKGTVSGLLNRKSLNSKLEEINKKIIQLQTDLEDYYKRSMTNTNLSPVMISILFMASEPIDTSKLRIGEEYREIHEKLQLARMRDRFQLHQRMSVRPADISQALIDLRPQIVHFSGHGTNTGALCFENQVGESHIVQPEALTALFEVFANQLNCVLLNACYSEIQAKAIAKHINYVIGMKTAIGDRAAIAFAIGFYQALGGGLTIEEAYKLGCVQIGLHSIPEHLTPILIKRQ